MWGERGVELPGVGVLRGDDSGLLFDGMYCRPIHRSWRKGRTIQFRLWLRFSPNVGRRKSLRIPFWECFFIRSSERRKSSIASFEALTLENIMEAKKSVRRCGVSSPAIYTRYGTERLRMGKIAQSRKVTRPFSPPGGSSSLRLSGGLFDYCICFLVVVGAGVR